MSQAILVCAPADAPRAVPGSRFDLSCSRCGRKVMVAPTGQRILRTIPDVQIVCGDCFEPTEVDTIEGAGTMEELLQEYDSARPNLRRNRN